MCENNDKSQYDSVKISRHATPIKLPFNKGAVKVKPLDRDRETKPRQQQNP